MGQIDPSTAMPDSQSLMNLEEIRLGESTAPSTSSIANPSIRQHCASEWPDDFQMRAFCEKQQQESLATLDQGAPSVIPADVYRTIQTKCEEEWETDFQMRDFCEQ